MDHETQLAVIRKRLLRAGIPEARLARMEATITQNGIVRGADGLMIVADKMHAMLEVELRLQGFDPNVLRSEEGREEAKKVAEIAAAARKGKLSAAQRKWLAAKTKADPLYVRHLLTRGAILDGKWRPMANARDVLAIEAALGGRS